MTVKSGARSFELNILSPGGTLAGLIHPSNVPQLTPSFSMTEAVAQEASLVIAANTNVASIGAIAQLTSVLLSTAQMKDTREAVRRIIVTGLFHEVLSSKLVDDIKNRNLPELAQYGTQLSFRYLLKNVSWPAMVAICASLAAPPVTLRILLSRISSQKVGGNATWATFHTDYDFDVGDLTQKLVAAFGGESAVAAACANWPAGPFPQGFMDRYAGMAQAAAANVSAVGASISQALSTVAAAVIDAVNATSNINTNSTTQGVNMSTATISATSKTAQLLAGINPALKPVIDGVLHQSGVPMSIDQLAQEITAKAEAEAALARLSKESSDSIADLRRQLAAAAAMPTHVTVQSVGKGIPDGQADLVEASSIFPQLAGLSLKVPSFTWSHPHPDVPAVNPDYIFRKEMLLKFLRCLVKNENAWLVGHTGTGKTTFVEQVMARLQWPVARIAFDSNVDRTELVGRMQLTADANGGTSSHWLPGILERAIVGGYYLLCDEMDAGHPNSVYTLQPLLEGKPLTLLEDGGRVVFLTPFFRIGATGNSAGNGDPSGLYPAVRILSAATLDRFAEFIEVPYMTQVEEEKLIKSSVPGLASALVKKLVKFAGEMRQAFIRGETPISYSPRRSVAFARAVDDFTTMGISDIRTVLSLTFKSKLYDAASEEFRQRITEIANNCLGGVDPTITLS